MSHPQNIKLIRTLIATKAKTNKLSRRFLAVEITLFSKIRKEVLNRREHIEVRYAGLRVLKLSNKD